MIKRLYKNIFYKSPWDDMEDSEEENIFTRKRNDNFNFENFNFDLNGKTIFLGIIAIFVLWLSSGIYKVEEGQQSLVMRFGKFNRISRAGLNFHLPYPIEQIYVEKVDESRRLELGYRSTGRAKVGGVLSSTDIKTESIMLTGDENIVSLHVDVTWHINDISKYIFMRKHAFL